MLVLFLVSSRSLPAILSGVIAGSFPAIGAVRRSQPEAQTAFFDFKGQATLFVIIGLVAKEDYFLGKQFGFISQNTICHKNSPF